MFSLEAVCLCFETNSDGLKILGAIIFTNRMMKLNAHPILESKMINELVIYHFSTLVLAGGLLCFYSLASDNTNE